MVVRVQMRASVHMAHSRKYTHLYWANIYIGWYDWYIGHKMKCLHAASNNGNKNSTIWPTFAWLPNIDFRLANYNVHKALKTLMFFPISPPPMRIYCMCAHCSDCRWNLSFYDCVNAVKNTSVDINTWHAMILFVFQALYFCSCPM